MTAPSQEAAERQERFVKFLRELVGLPKVEETMNTLPIEARPMCPQCGEPADPMFHPYCSASCESDGKGPEVPDHECYCGKVRLFPDEGNYCSRECRAADESDRG